MRGCGDAGMKRESGLLELTADGAELFQHRLRGVAGERRVRGRSGIATR